MGDLEQKEVATEILQKLNFSSVWIFLHICDLEGIFSAFILSLLGIGNCVIVLSLGLVAALSRVQFKDFILFWKQVISVLQTGKLGRLSLMGGVNL